VSDSGSSRSSAARANGASGWFRAKVCLEVDGDPDGAAEVVGLVELLHHLGVEQRGEQLLGARHVLGLLGLGLVVLGEQAVERCASVAGPVEHVEQHRVAHREAGGERFGRRVHQAVERGLAPRHLAGGRLLLLDLADLLVLLGPRRRLRGRLVVLDDVVGGEGDDGAHRVEAGPPGAAADLVELPGAEQAGRRAVVLGEGGEDHGADGHVDADAEGVGPADDLEQPGLGQPLHQAPVLGQHPRVVDADAVAHELGERLAEPRGEAEPADELGDLILLGRVSSLTLISDCARSTAEAWVKCTTYTGAWCVDSSSSSTSVSGVIRNWWTRGMGRVAERTTATGRPVRSGSVSVNRVTSPSVADIKMNCASGSSSSGTCHAQPRSGSAKKWNSSMTTWPTSASRPSRRARLARISAVQQMIGASGLTEASPVSMPTLSAPNVADRSKNFSDTSALMGAV
jgi:hypothetical protein